MQTINSYVNTKDDPIADNINQPIISYTVFDHLFTPREKYL